VHALATSCTPRQGAAAVERSDWRMTDGFYVNTEHLGHFERQVDRQLDYVDRAMDTMDLTQMKEELGASGGVAGVSALGWVVPSVEKWLDRAADDNDAVKRALSRSRASLGFSLDYYNKAGP